MDLRLALMSGIDIPVIECKTFVHQPTIKEISFVGENDYFMGAQCLCINKNALIEKDSSLLTDTNNFQIFMTIMSEKDTVDKRNSVLQVLSLLFPNMKVTMTPRSLLLMQSDQTITIDEDNFEYLQEVLKKIFCIASGPMDTQSFNPADEKAREIAQKLMRGRQRVAEQNGQANSSLFSRYISVLTIGINSMSLSDILNLTMYQLYDLLERYTLYTDWDIDIRSRLAGGKPDSKPDNWMKNIH